MNRIKEVHAFALINRVDCTKFLITNLLQIPAIHYARAIFDRTPNPQIFLYNKFIQHYASDGPYEQCLVLYSKLHRHGGLPNRYTFPFMLKACACLLSASIEGQKLHAHISKLGFGNDVVVFTALIDMYAKSGCLNDAHQVFDEMNDRDLPAWNSLIGGYARLGRLNEAKGLFDRMSRRNVISWTSMISGCSQNGRFREALDMYAEMVENDVKPNHVTIASVLPACAHLGALEIGGKIDTYARENGYFENIFVGNALVEMYAKCGRIDMAWKVFGEINKKNVCSWNSMITGLAMHGRWEEALILFEDMLHENLVPDDITFVGVLCACTHGGLVRQGWRYFDSMRDKFSISPKLEHYSCIIDLLGRAGKLREAYEMLIDMPMRPDSVVWGTLLGACSFHANVEFGEIAAEMLFELEPWNPGNYVIMSNIYAAAGRWDGVAEMRLLMKSQTLRKSAGYSLIEVKQVLHKFMAEDDSHPSRNEIYMLLDDLTAHMMLFGFPIVEIEF